MAEASTIREALEECSRDGLSNIIIVSDAREVVRMIRTEIGVDAEVESIVNDIWANYK